MDFLPIPAIISNPRSSSQRPSSVFLELFISYKTNKPHLGAKHSYHSSFLSLPCPYHQKLCPGPYKASVFPKTPGRDASIVLAMPPLIWWLKGSWRRERNPNVPRVPDSSASKTEHRRRNSSSWLLFEYVTSVTRGARSSGSRGTTQS